MRECGPFYAGWIFYVKLEKCENIFGRIIQVNRKSMIPYFHD